MRALLLLGLLGCDRVFGLNGRTDPDAAPGSDMLLPHDDAMLDGAPIGCPASGPPAFSPTPIFIAASCIGYTTSVATGDAMMTCAGAIAEGEIGSGDVTPSTIRAEQGQTPIDPRLSPEGDKMFVSSRSGATQTIRIYTFSNSQWQLSSVPASLPTEVVSDPLFVSPPTRATGARYIVLYHGLPSARLFTEYVDDGADGWTKVRDYMPTDLAVTSFDHPSISPDGLHLVFTTDAGAGAEIRYSHRDYIEDPFDTSVRVPVPFPDVHYPHMAPDCSRLYFTANGNTFYVKP